MPPFLTPSLSCSSCFSFFLCRVCLHVSATENALVSCLHVAFQEPLERASLHFIWGGAAKICRRLPVSVEIGYKPEDALHEDLHVILGRAQMSIVKNLQNC
jgi:hypothetical protein